MSVLRSQSGAGYAPVMAPCTRGARPDAGSNRRQLDLLIRNFTHLLHSEVALLCQLGRGAQLQIISSWGTSGAPERVVGASRRYWRWGYGGGFVGRAPTYRRPAFEPLDSHRDSGLIDAAPGPRLTHAAAIPVRVPGGTCSGLIAGFAGAPDDLPSTLSTAESYAELIALYLQHPGMLNWLLETGREDALTGCLTYDSSMRELAREINRSARGGVRLACCFIDLDDFKSVKDRLGHIHGNRVLAAIAEVLRDGVRSCDTVGRYGGDEFIAILPQTSRGEAFQLAERLKALIAAAQIAGADRGCRSADDRVDRCGRVDAG